MDRTTKNAANASRRDFLKTSGGLLLGTALAGAITSRSYAGEDNTIKLALVGTGPRSIAAISQTGKRNRARTGADAIVGSGLDFVSGLHMGLPKITRRSGTLARPLCSWNSGALKRLVALK